MPAANWALGGFRSEKKEILNKEKRGSIPRTHKMFGTVKKRRNTFSYSVQLRAESQVKYKEKVSYPIKKKMLKCLGRNFLF